MPAIRMRACCAGQDIFLLSFVTRRTLAEIAVKTFQVRWFEFYTLTLVLLFIRRLFLKVSPYWFELPSDSFWMLLFLSSLWGSSLSVLFMLPSVRLSSSLTFLREPLFSLVFLSLLPYSFELPSDWAGEVSPLSLISLFSPLSHLGVVSLPSDSDSSLSASWTSSSGTMKSCIESSPLV